LRKIIFSLLGCFYVSKFFSSSLKDIFNEMDKPTTTEMLGFKGAFLKKNRTGFCKTLAWQIPE